MCSMNLAFVSIGRFSCYLHETNWKGEQPSAFRWRPGLIYCRTPHEDKYLDNLHRQAPKNVSAMEMISDGTVPLLVECGSNCAIRFTG